MDLSEFLLAWRTAALPDREVIDALVHPAHAGPSPTLARHLLLVRRAGRTPLGADAPARASTPRGVGAAPAALRGDAVYHHVRGRRAQGRHPVRPESAGARARHVPLPGGLRPRLGNRALLRRAAPHHPAVSRAGPLPHGTALSARCVAALLHSRPGRPA